MRILPVFLLFCRGFRQGCADGPAAVADDATAAGAEPQDARLDRRMLRAALRPTMLGARRWSGGPERTSLGPTHLAPPPATLLVGAFLSGVRQRRPGTRQSLSVVQRNGDGGGLPMWASAGHGCCWASACCGSAAKIRRSAGLHQRLPEPPFIGSTRL